MNLIKYLPLLFLFYGVISCSDHITNNYYDTEVGFTFRTYASSDSLLTLNVFTNKVLNSIPSIKVAGRLPDTPQTWIYNWNFSKLEANKPIYYEIDYNGETLCDSIFLPCPVDSVFINNQYVANHNSVFLPYDSMYTISWKDNSKANYYSLYTYSFTGAKRTDSLFSGLSINVFPEFDTSYIQSSGNLDMSINITKIFTKDRYAGSLPDKRSKGLFAYYYFESQYYNANLLVN